MKIFHTDIAALVAGLIPLVVGVAEAVQAALALRSSDSKLGRGKA